MVLHSRCTFISKPHRHMRHPPGEILQHPLCPVSMSRSNARIESACAVQMHLCNELAYVHSLISRAASRRLRVAGFLRMDRGKARCQAKGAQGSADSRCLLLLWRRVLLPGPPRHRICAAVCGGGALRAAPAAPPCHLPPQRLHQVKTASAFPQLRTPCPPCRCIGTRQYTIFLSV